MVANRWEYILISYRELAVESPKNKTSENGPILTPNLLGETIRMSE